MGDWKLLFTTSPSFVFNGGFTGVAATTPGGASFESLNQKLIRTPVGFLEVSLFCPLGTRPARLKTRPAERCRTKKNCALRFLSSLRCAMCCASYWFVDRVGHRNGVTGRRGVGAPAPGRPDLEAAQDLPEGYAAVGTLRDAGRSRRPRRERVRRGRAFTAVIYALNTARARLRWKSMRALNAAELLYLQDDLRIMKGSTAFYVFEKAPREGGGGGSTAPSQ